MKIIKGVIWRIAVFVVANLAFVGLMLAALVERRRSRRGKPRVFWGTAPLINIKYHSQAVRLLGYESVTVVDWTSFINANTDFDFHSDDIANESRLMRLLPLRGRQLIRDYYVFVWAMHRFDVYNFYYTGGILRSTPLKYKEAFLLRLAKKKTVFTAFGGDVQTMSFIRNLLYKHTLIMDYPDFPRHEAQTRKDVVTFSQQADYVIAGVDWVDYMPRWDKLVSAHFAIDTAAWKPDPEWRTAPAGKVVKVLHAPNHRTIKGTSFLIQACNELKEEGVPLELVLVERVANTRIHELMQECDIVADQFIVGWYAMFALEGMSMGKPVLTYLRPDLLELYTLYSWAGECPLVNTPALRIKEILREMVEHPELRAEIGAKGRAYVEKYHSLEAIGRMFDEVYREIWQPGEAGSSQPHEHV